MDIARWSEEAGCSGTLIYADNSLVDPWLVAQAVIRRTETLCPLVAVQPIYMHPYAAAKMVATYAFLYGRQIFLNMVAGGFVGDLQALNDPTPHDERYARLTEYTQVIKLLLSTSQPVSFEGRYYTLRNVRLIPPLPPELMPAIFMSGSSTAGTAAALATGATAVIYPQPVEQERDNSAQPHRRGVRLGIIARDTADEAWMVAHERFPNDPKGRFTHKLAAARSDSVWHKQLSLQAQQPQSEPSPYWLWPFETYKTFCPYLVGSYDEVGQYLAGYLAKGYRTYLLDVPRAREDLDFARAAFARALTAETAIAVQSQGANQAGIILAED